MIFNDIKLKEHQKKVVHFYLNSNRKGLVAFHTVGSGKTITSIASAKCLMSIDKKLKVIILTPVSVYKQFKNEVDHLILDKTQLNRITISTHKKWLNKYERGEVNAKNSFLIVDEVHKFKGANALYAKLLNKATKEAKKILLLTATPIENNPIEIRNYMAMINDNSFLTENKNYERMNVEDDLKQLIKYSEEIKKMMLLAKIKIDKKYKENMMMIEIQNEIQEQLSKYDLTIDELLDGNFKQKYLECKFSYFQSIKNINDYPSVKEHIIQLKMPIKYQIEYEKIEENKLDLELKAVFDIKETEEPANLSVFLNGLRRAVNKLNIKSPKIDWIINHIKRELMKNKKVVVYSNWVKFGIKEVENELIENNIKYGLIIGSISTKKRNELINNYNKNKIKVLLITSAGAEGIDLKETRSVIIMEPYWHYSRIEQVIGRAVRYKSHNNLPIKKRTVNIYHILLVKNKHNDVKFALSKFFINTFDFLKKKKRIKKQKKRTKKQKKQKKTKIVKPSIDVILYNLSIEKKNNIDNFYKDIKLFSIENKIC